LIRDVKKLISYKIRLGFLSDYTEL